MAEQEPISLIKGLRLLFFSGADDRWIDSCAHTLDAAALERGGEILYAAVNAPSLVSGCAFDMRHSRAFLPDETAHEKERALFLLMQKLLTLAQPDAAIVWNGMRDSRAAFTEAARSLSLPLFFAEKGYLAGSWFIDEQGIGPRSRGLRIEQKDLTPSPPEFTAFIEDAITRGASAWNQPLRRSTHELRETLKIPPDRQLLFFAGQVDDDVNLQTFSEHFKTSLECLKWLVQTLPPNEFFILVKPHPKGRTTPSEFQSVLGSTGLASAALNVHDAIALADCVASINSTVGIEASLAGKPVLQFGDTPYSELPFVACLSPIDNALEKLRDFLAAYRSRREDLRALALAYAYYLHRNMYAYQGDLSSSTRLLEKIAAAAPERRRKALAVSELATHLSEASVGELMQRGHVLRAIRKFARKSRRG